MKTPLDIWLRKEALKNSSSVSENSDAVSFDYAMFQARKPHTYSQLYKQIREGNDFVVEKEQYGNLYYCVSFNGYLMVFDIAENHHFTYARPKWYRKKEKIIDWVSLREIARSTEGLNQRDLVDNPDVQMVIIPLKELLGKESDVTFSLRELLLENDFYTVLEKRFAVNEHERIFKLKQAINDADPNDPFYSDLKVSYKSALDDFNTVLTEYVAELEKFKKTVRHYEHLSLLSEMKK